MKACECRWSVNWAGADRREIFDSLRTVDERFAEEAARRASAWDDDDHETIVTCVDVATLAEALRLLTATEKVRCHYGRHLHVNITDEFASVYAHLSNGDDGFAPQSAQVSYRTRKERDAAFLSAVNAIDEATHTLRDINRLTEA